MSRLRKLPRAASGHGLGSFFTGQKSHDHAQTSQNHRRRTGSKLTNFRSPQPGQIMILLRLESSTACHRPAGLSCYVRRCCGNNMAAGFWGSIPQDVGAVMTAERLRIGTSGWHYPTGRGTWNGAFYPKPRPKGFDELEYYARFFDTVEVNSTFYGQPRANVSEQWATRTPRDFVFCTKLFQQFTHPKMFQARVKTQLEATLDGADIPLGAIEALTQANQADIDEFRRGVEPLADSHKLGALLAQFPPSFRATTANRIHLLALLAAFAEYPIAVELRHRSWSDQVVETRALLHGFHATWVWIDEPKFKDSVQQVEPDTESFVYMRLHGRNAKAWWRGSNEERYDYDYSAEELTPIAEKVKGRMGYIYANNHPNARAISTARLIRALVGQPAEVAPDVSRARTSD